MSQSYAIRICVETKQMACIDGSGIIQQIAERPAATGRVDPFLQRAFLGITVIVDCCGCIGVSNKSVNTKG